MTELVEGEELFEKINRLGKIAEPEAAIYFGQLVDAISYLNDRSICHRDIKPENIIVRDSELKVIDFGLSSIYDNETGLNTSCGSPCYAAP